MERVLSYMFKTAMEESNTVKDRRRRFQGQRQHVKVSTKHELGQLLHCSQAWLSSLNGLQFSSKPKIVINYITSAIGFCLQRYDPKFLLCAHQTFSDVHQIPHFLNLFITSFPRLYVELYSEQHTRSPQHRSISRWKFCLTGTLFSQIVCNFFPKMWLLFPLKKRNLRAKRNGLQGIAISPH